MKRRTFITLLAGALPGLAAPAPADDALVVVAHAPLRGLDAEALRRIYTGRMIELENQVLRPVNLPPGHPARKRFLALVMQQDDEDYLAYWTVRRYVGKGAPPRELATPADVVNHVRSTPGAIGYLEPADLKPGLTVVLRLPGR